MQLATTTSPSSSRQFKRSTSRSKSSSRSAWSEQEDPPIDVSASNNSRYRVLDEGEQRRETEEVERIIKDLEIQRRGRTESSRSRPSSSKQQEAQRTRGAPIFPMKSGSPRMKGRTKSTPRGSTGPSLLDSSSSLGDQQMERISVGDSVPQSFQEQVLQELQKLKEAQRLEFEALERLQREKDEAERKARRLELKVREQQRQLRQKGELQPQRTRSPAVVHPIKGRRQETSPHEDVDLELEDESQNDASNNHSDNGDACGKEDDGIEYEAEEIEWDDSKSPPPYFDADTLASPATSPFKRSSGWPAWSADDAPSKWARSTPEATSLPVASRPRNQRSRSRSDLRAPEASSSPGRRPSSARAPSSSHLRQTARSRSRSPSATRIRCGSQDSQGVRRSGAFFEDKARAEAEAQQLAKEALERMQRAHRATPPQQLLDRQALAHERKTQQLKQLEREMNAELSREKKVKAHDVPLTTYLSMDEAEEAEQQRKERIRLRSQETLQAAALPPRMAVANGNASANAIATASTGDQAEIGHISVKLKKKLAKAAEEEAGRRNRRPKAVPNFDQLHAQWDRALQKRKALARRTLDEEEAPTGDGDAPSKKKSAEFFTSRAAELAELRDRKEARKQRLLAKEEAIRQHARRKQEKLLTRARVSLGGDVGSQRKPTKSEELRVQKVLAEAAKQQKEREREERATDARERKREEAARRVRAQVKRSENVRRETYSGTIVDVKSLDALAKEKAREQRQQFKEAIARNREKLLAAAAARPSLMERFTTGVKRESHRRAALEAVVKNVFQKDLSVLKGVLTDDEQELAREMVAADDEGGNDDEAAD